MKKRITATALAVILTTTILLTMVTFPVSARPSLHKLAAGGTVDFSGFMESYGFTARQTNEDGTATGHGHMTYHYPSPSGATPWILDSDILYLAVDAGAGEAWIGAVITSSNDPGWLGIEYVVRVKDGGKGKDAGQDMISYVDVSRTAIEALDMPTDGFLTVLVPWTNGNVHIQ